MVPCSLDHAGVIGIINATCITFLPLCAAKMVLNVKQVGIPKKIFTFKYRHRVYARPKFGHPWQCVCIYPGAGPSAGTVLITTAGTVLFPSLFLWPLTIFSSTYPWRRHQMETFSTSLAICAGNSPVTGEFWLLKGQWCWALIFLWSPPE